MVVKIAVLRGVNLEIQLLNEFIEKLENLRKWNQNLSNIDKSSIKIDQKLTKFLSWKGLGPVWVGLPGSVLGLIWTPAGAPLGVAFEAKWGSCWNHVGSKILFRRSWMAFKSDNDV